MNWRWKFRHFLLMLEAEYLAYKACWQIIVREYWRR